MEKQPSPHSPASIARNISIGVLTSVLAATIIYFLGYNRNDKQEFNKKKEATIKVWGAYQENLRITSTLFDQLAIMKEENIAARLDEINHELDVALGNMENVKREAGADTRVYSTIDIRVQQFKEGKPLFNKYFQQLITLQTDNTPDAEATTIATNMVESLKKELATIKSRDSFRLATYYDGLNKDYDVVLPLNTKASRGQ